MLCRVDRACPATGASPLSSSGEKKISSEQRNRFFFAGHSITIYLIDYITDGRRKAEKRVSPLRTLMITIPTDHALLLSMGLGTFFFSLALIFTS